VSLSRVLRRRRRQHERRRNKLVVGVGPRVGVGKDFGKSRARDPVCALAYAIAWSVMKMLVPRFKKIENLG
jgi:hypothetical protein